MANAGALCLLVITILCCTELSFARRVQREDCTEEWCSNGLQSNEKTIFCDACTGVITIGTSLFLNKAVQKASMLGLEMVCRLVPFGLTNECTTLVETYVPVLFKMLATLLDPHGTCSLIGLCSYHQSDYYLK